MSALFIYHVSWAFDGDMGLNAVVVAANKEEAIKLLKLTESDKCVSANCVGAAFTSLRGASVLAMESV